MKLNDLDMDYKTTKDAILEDSSVHHFVKRCIQELEDYDPLDALNNAKILQFLFKKKVDEIFKQQEII